MPKKNPELLKRLMVAGAPRENAQRAIDRGLTEDDVEWNVRLNRPLHWLETVHPEEEEKRREVWQDAH